MSHITQIAGFTTGHIAVIMLGRRGWYKSPAREKIYVPGGKGARVPLDSFEVLVLPLN